MALVSGKCQIRVELGRSQGVGVGIQLGSFVKWSNMALFGGKRQFMVELGGSQGVGVGGKLGGLLMLNLDPFPIVLEPLRPRYSLIHF